MMTAIKATTIKATAQVLVRACTRPAGATSGCAGYPHFLPGWTYCGESEHHHSVPIILKWGVDHNFWNIVWIGN